MLASSFLDPVLGLDIHFEMVPTPAPVPLPIPNPFIGLVFDPIGLAAGIAIGAAIGAVVGAPFQGPVLYWTAFPATNTGTEAKHVPGHILIPPGTAWAPFPKTPKPVIHPGETPAPGLPVKPENDAVVVFGSKTVTVMGSNAVRLGDIALSCSEPLRLPSSVVLAVPKGAPILIGGPMSFDIMSAIMASLRTRFVSDSLHALVSRLKPSRFRNFLHRAVCFFTGHPVDVASGKVMTEFVDIELPGPLPLKVERIYSSAFAARPGVLGHGWSLSLDQAVWRERGKVVLRGEDGRELEFDTFGFPRHRIEPGQEVYDPIQRLTLRCEKDGAWRVVDHEGVVREFAPVPGRDDGRAMIQKIRSRCGFHEITYHYGSEGAARGRLEWVRDSGGRFVHLRWDAKGRVTELHLPQPQGEGFYRHRRYEYDAAGDLVQVTDSLGHAWKFAYVTHLLTQETDRNGLSFYFLYDGLGEDAWCVRTWGDGGIYDHVLSYDKSKKITYVTNSLGHVTQYHMNVVGQVVKIVDPLGGETRYEYDARTLQRTKLIDPLKQELTLKHDVRGNLSEVVGPDGTTTTLTHDERNLCTSMVNPMGARWSWRYDGSGLLDAQSDPLQHVLRIVREGGDIVALIDAAGERTHVQWDRRHDLIELTTTNGARARWRYDALGNVIEANDFRGNVRRYQYDSEGRLLEVVEPDHNVRSFVYDREGNVLVVADKLRRLEFSYSGKGRLARRANADSLVQFEHDSEEQLVGFINELGHLHQIERDPVGHPSKEVQFDGHTTVYERDAAGRLIRVCRGNGSEVLHCARDEAGRVVAVTYGDGNVESFTYRPDGELIEASNPSMRVCFERDALGQVTKELQGEHWIESRYDHHGFKIETRTSLGARQRIVRNAVGHCTEVLLSQGRAHWHARFTRDATGLELGRQLPGGVFVLWERDAQGRPVTHGIEGNAGALRTRRYTWSVDDRIRAIEEVPSHTVQYTHDARGYLVSAHDTMGHEAFLAPDVVGNVFRNPLQVDRAYGAAGQLLRAHTVEGVMQYDHDDDGNRIRRSEPDGTSWHYRWGSNGTLLGVEPPHGPHVAFEYDALGRRVSKTVDGVKTCWLWDGNLPVHTWKEVATAPGDAAPRNLETWAFDPGSFAPISRLTDDDGLSVVADHLGTPLCLVDMTGTITWQASTTIWGEVLIHGDPTQCSLRMPGQIFDPETGLCYNRFRYFDPAVGLYISRDPLGMEGGWELYAYAAPSTLVYTDPLGLAVTLDQLRMALGRSGHSARDYAFRAASAAEEAESAGTRYASMSADGAGRVATDAKGRPIITFYERGLQNMDEAMASFFHETGHIHDYRAGVNAAREFEAENFGQRMMKKARERLRKRRRSSCGR